MKPRELLFAAVGVFLILLGAFLSQRGDVFAIRAVIETPGCRVPITILQPPDALVTGSAVVFHGLSSNRGLMDIYGEQLAAAGLRVFLPDFPGHGDNPEPFSFESAQKCATQLVLFLQRTGRISPSRTILAGHSMGGAIAIGLADHFPAQATIAISPAPMAPAAGIPAEFIFFSLPRRLPTNLLVFRGGLEPRLIAESDRTLIQIANSGLLQSGDHSSSLLGRPAHLVSISHATHTGILFDPRMWRQSVAWTRETLQMDAGIHWKVHAPLLGGLCGLAGIFLLLPTLATVLAKCFIIAPQGGEVEAPRLLKVLCHFVIAFALAALVLRYWVPLRAVRILTGDYLASFFLLSGLYLLLAFRGSAKQVFSASGKSVLFAAAFSFVVLLGAGAWLNWRLDDAWMNTARWARFFPLVVACLPYFAAEEISLGPPGPGRVWTRLLRYTLLRGAGWGMLVLAFFLLHSGQLLIILLAAFFALISVFQRLGMDFVRRRTGSAAAAAVFGAILGAWFLAAVLPLT
jgi:pimeloyl-ACP methyl ester carboxylesterase